MSRRTRMGDMSIRSRSTRAWLTCLRCARFLGIFLESVFTSACHSSSTTSVWHGDKASRSSPPVRPSSLLPPLPNPFPQNSPASSSGPTKSVSPPPASTSSPRRAVSSLLKMATSPPSPSSPPASSPLKNPSTSGEPLRQADGRTRLSRLRRLSVRRERGGRNGSR